MAQPTNTFDSYDAKGIREDLENVIYDISPEETPFYSGSKKVTASNTYHEWQTDALRASGANAHIEGDATTAEARTATTRLGNYTQIFKNAVVIPDTDKGSYHGPPAWPVFHSMNLAPGKPAPCCWPAALKPSPISDSQTCGWARPRFSSPCATVACSACEKGRPEQLTLRKVSSRGDGGDAEAAAQTQPARGRQRQHDQSLESRSCSKTAL